MSKRREPSQPVIPHLMRNPALPLYERGVQRTGCVIPAPAGIQRFPLSLLLLSLTAVIARAKLVAILFVILTLNLFQGKNLAFAAHSATNHLVISEVQLAGSGGALDEFVELYNPTCYDIDLSAIPLRLHIRNSGGTDAHKPLTYTGSSVIPAHSYFLIGTSSYTSSVSLNATYSGSGNTLVSNGSVYISTTTTNFSGSPGPGSLAIDMVGFGSQPSGGFETQTTTNPASGNAAARKPNDSNGNGQDTNDNSVDFSTATSSPDNASTPARPPLPANIAPSASITQPPNPSSGVVTLSAQAWDNDACGRVVRVEFFYSTTSDIGPWTFISSDTHNSDYPSTTTYTVQWKSPTGRFPQAWARALAVDHKGLTGASVSNTFSIVNELNVVMNEIAWMGTTASASDEWIELKNNLTHQSVNLTGWVLKSTDGTPTINLSGTIPAGGFFLLERSTDNTISNIIADLIYTGALGDAGEFMLLLDDKGVLVDSAPWNASWPAGNSATKSSMERRDPKLFGDISTNWSTNDGITRNGLDASTNPVNGTPKSKNSAFDITPPSAVTTLTAQSGTKDKEIVLTWTAPGDDGTIGTATLYDLRITTAGAILTDADFTAATPLPSPPPSPAGGEETLLVTALVRGAAYYFALKTRDEINHPSHFSALSNTAAAIAPDHPPAPPSGLTAKLLQGIRIFLKWNANSEDDLDSYSLYRTTVSGTGYILISSFSAPTTTYIDSNLTEGVTYYYVMTAKDFQNNQSTNSVEISKLARRIVPPDGKIILNEIMYDPSTTEPDTEWAELYNKSTETVDMQDSTFGDNTGTYTFAEAVYISSGQFFVVARTTNAASGLVNVAYGGASQGAISFDNTSDIVFVKNPAGAVVDQLIYFSTWGAANGSGPNNYSLQRKSFSSVTQDQTNWGEALDQGGTPQAANRTDLTPASITHTPITQTVIGKDIGIHATITDNLAPLVFGQAKIFWRKTGESNFKEVIMFRVADTTFDGLIPGSSVTSAGIDYYIWTIDKHNNVATHGSASSPHQVTAVTNPYQLVINEFMYDPPGAEPDNEWAELHNFGSTAIDLSGWKFTDGEGTFVIPSGQSIPANGFYVLARSSSATSNYNILYGTAAGAGNLQFINTLAEITDQVIIKDPTDLIIDEVNYSSEWGAQNGTGPNNHTLERLSATANSNSSTTWLYSMVQGGTPRAKNSSHIIRNIKASPTAIDPLVTGSSVTIEYDLMDTATVDVKIYNSSATLIRTVLAPVSQSPGHHSVIWDGKDANGVAVQDICTFEVHAVNAQEESLSNANDRLMTFTDKQIFSRLWLGGGEGTAPITYKLSKPARITLDVKRSATNEFVRNLITAAPRGSGANIEVWDTRDSTGIPAPMLRHFGQETVEDIFGNVIVSLTPLKIQDVKATPKSSFDPTQTPTPETATISYKLNIDATVTVEIISLKTKQKVRTLLGPVTQSAGQQSVVWDGKDDGGVIVPDGRYIFNITAQTTVNRKTRVSGDLMVLTFSQ